MSNKYRKKKNGNPNGNHDVLGVTLIVISAFLLLCIAIKPILGVFSEAIFGVMLGVFGIASYPMLLATIFLGVNILLRHERSVSKKTIVCTALIVIFALIVLQLVSTYAFLDNGLATYIDEVYSAKYSAGGIVVGVVAYGLSAAITDVACYIICALGIAVCVIAITSAVSRLRDFWENRKGKKQSPPEQNKPPRDETFTSETAQLVVNAVPSHKLYTELLQRRDAQIVTESGNASEMADATDVRIIGDYKSSPVVEQNGDGKHSAIAAAARNKLYADSDEIKKQAAAAFRAARPSVVPTVEPAPYAEPVAYVEPKPIPVTPVAGGNVIMEPAVRVENDARNNVTELRRVDFDGKPHNLNALYFPLDKNIKFNDDGIENIDEMRAEYETKLDDRKADRGARAGFAAPPVFGMSSATREVEPVEKIIDASQPLSADYAANASYTKPEDRFMRAMEQSDIRNRDALPLESEKFKPDDIIDAYAESHKFESSGAAVRLEQRTDILDGSLPLESEEDIHGLGIYAPDDEDIIDGSLVASDEPTVDSTHGSLVVSDEPAVDLTRRDFDGGDVFTGGDLSGLYVAADNVPQAPQPKSQKRQKSNSPIENQITIDNILKEKAEESIVTQDMKKYKKYDYVAPPLDLLKNYERVDSSQDELQANARKLEEVVSSFLKAQVQVKDITVAPQVTRYELDVPSGTSVNSIASHSADIAYELASASGVRVEAPIPGKRAVGIEVPNRHKSIVGLREVVESQVFSKHKSRLVFSVGKDIGGELVVCDLEKIPHLLIAGQTGSGKSAGLNSLIVSLLYKSSPEDLRFILIDPKRVEFSKFRGMPHSLFEKTITEPTEALNALKWAQDEMNRRYIVLQKYTCSKLSEYNDLPDVKSGKVGKLPHIVIIIDELANLMQSSVSKEIESKICSIAALARAAGIHLIVATQRPSVDVITGTIKANLSSRIAFKVPDANNSRIIIDYSGAEQLAGDGDMLFYPQDAYSPRRVQGSFVDGEEVLAVVTHLKERYECDFDEEAEAFVTGGGGSTGGESSDVELDPLAPRIMAHAIKSKQISTSVIQRRFSIGYSRAARIIDVLEESGYVGQNINNKPRDVIMTEEQYKEVFGHDIDDN